MMRKQMLMRVTICKIHRALVSSKQMGVADVLEEERGMQGIGLAQLRIRGARGHD
jgi:hypothetical protein